MPKTADVPPPKQWENSPSPTTQCVMSFSSSESSATPNTNTSPSKDKDYLKGSDGKMFIGNGLKAMVKVGGYANKKQSDMPVPMYQLPRSRRRRRRRFERHFEASVKSSKEPWFGPAKKCFSGKDGWVTTLVHSPTANLQLLLKHTDGKDTYQLIRTSLLDYASEVVVKGDMNSKIKFKKAKSAADQIKQFEQAAKDLVQLYDAFRAKAHDENGLKKSYLVSDELIAAGVFKKGVPIHCKCGKHKINILHGDEKSCLDFHTAIERLRGMVQL